MRKLFVDRVIDLTKEFLDNNQRTKLKEILTEICLNYQDNITKMLEKINLPIEEITTEILRDYLADYKNNSKAGMVTIDNIRRTLSSFFAWLENEDYIVKSPVRRIHKVKTTKRVKETLTDENLEKLRDTCSNVKNEYFKYNVKKVQIMLNCKENQNVKY